MKFIYSDSRDLVDPNYDFLNDQNAKGREVYWDDVYAHQMLNPAPYDGLLVSMSSVRSADGITNPSRYSLKEEQRFVREGARKFLRFDHQNFQDSLLLGDCGAFAYVKNEKPAFSPEEVAEFYEDAGFSHGVSPDHIIFNMYENFEEEKCSKDDLKRYDITLENAEAFFKIVKTESYDFEPLGAVQGWSPKSMAKASKKLEKIGFRFLAVGGLVPLKSEKIKDILKNIRDVIKPETRIHLLGFAKAEEIHEFKQFNIFSFDSTSPLIRAFKDKKANFYSLNQQGKLDYYAAIRIAQANDSSKLIRGIKSGAYCPDQLQSKEKLALETLRFFDVNKVSKEKVITTVLDYIEYQLRGQKLEEKKIKKEIEITNINLDRTLTDKPWKFCDCLICKEVGVEVIIFRGNNRNRRRGFHNLWVYKKHLKNLNIK